MNNPILLEILKKELFSTNAATDITTINDFLITENFSDNFFKVLFQNNDESL
jgi:hypothetical protein